MRVSFAAGCVLSLLLGVAWLNCVPDAKLAPTLGPGGAGGSGASVTGAGGNGASAVGGSGGEGATANVGGGPAVLKSFDASAPNMTSFSYDDLGGWLIFKSPNDGSGGAPERTSQIGPSSLKRGYTTADVARARNPDDTAWGLSVESERSNLLPYSDSLGPSNWNSTWVGGAVTQMVAVESQNDPAGGTAAVHFTADASGDPCEFGSCSRGYTESGGAISVWAKGLSGGLTPGAGGSGAGGSGAGGSGAGGSASSETYYAFLRHNSTHLPITSYQQWQRLHDRTSGQGGFGIRSKGDDRGEQICVDDSTFAAFGAQLEDDDATYASSYIPTGNAPVTRAAESLYTEQATTVVPGGYYHARLVFRTSYGPYVFLSDSDRHILLHFNGTNAVFIERASEGKSRVCMATDAEEKCSAGLDWEAEQELTITVKHTANGRSLKVAGHSGPSWVGTWGAAAPIAEIERVHILSKPSGAAHCADLLNIVFYQP